MAKVPIIRNPLRAFRRTLIQVTTWLLVYALAIPGFAANMELLGDLDGGNFQSFGFGISTDGLVVAGSSKSAQSAAYEPGYTEAYRWTSTTGMVGLGDLPGDGFDSWAYDLSYDGKVIVGYSRFGPDTNDIQAYRWTATEGMIGLGGLSASGVSLATAVSGNGAVVVGGAIATTGTQAFRWDAINGLVGLGYFPGGGFHSYARGVSTDGTYIVGSASTPAGSQGFLWTATDGYTGLGDLSGGTFFSSAYAVSEDGSVVVGGSISALSGNDREPFRWTSETGMVSLGDLPGGPRAGYALAVSANGEVIVGFSESGRGQEGFVWTAATGMVNLTDYLTGLGVDTGGLFIGAAYDVSADGRYVSGSMTNADGFTEAYVVDLAPLLLDVEIDFDPWSTTNEFRPNDTYLVTVGVKSLGIAHGDAIDFDATQVDPDSLEFGPAAGTIAALPITQDLDGDGDTDLVVGFRAEESGVTCDDAAVSLTGSTYAGELITGSDAITTTECETSGCHP